MYDIDDRVTVEFCGGMIGVGSKRKGFVVATTSDTFESGGTRTNADVYPRPDQRERERESERARERERFGGICQVQSFVHKTLN